MAATKRRSRGWRRESARHSLAARGIRSVPLKPQRRLIIKQRMLRKPHMVFMSWDSAVVTDGYYDYTIKLKHNQVDEPEAWWDELMKIKNEMSLYDIVKKYKPQISVCGVVRHPEQYAPPKSYSRKEARLMRHLGFEMPQLTERQLAKLRRQIGRSM